MSKPAPMGHNGGFSFDSRSDIPSDVPRLFFYKFSIQDVLDDILKMPKDERGVYLTALFVMYKEMEGLPSDDKMAALSLGLDVREWRHIKPKLIARGVLFERPSGRISNRRFEAEISSYVTEFKNRQEAAVLREQRKREEALSAERSPRDRREIAPTSPRDRRDVGSIPATIAPAIGEDFSKNTNKNNETTGTSGPRADHESRLRARDLLVTSYESKKEERTINQAEGSESQRAGEGSERSPEASLTAGQRTAIRMLSVLFGSDTEPDHDRGYAVGMEYTSRHDPEDVIEAAEDFQARKRDRTEHRQFTERLFAEYVRMAKANRKRRETGVPAIEKPTPRFLPPGPIAEGIELHENGDLILMNGARAEWVELFGGNEQLLDLTLKGAGAKLRPGEPPLGQIRRLLASACRNIVARRANAVEIAKQTDQLRRMPTAAGEVGKIETRAQRLERMMDDIVRSEGGVK